MDIRTALNRSDVTEWFAWAIRTGAAVGLLVGAVAVAAQPQVQATASSSATVAPANVRTRVDDGRRRYTGMCARCHGLNLVSNGIGFDLRTFPADGKERFRLSVRKGLRAMPSFDTSITENDIDAVWAYIGSVNGWNP